MPLVILTEETEVPRPDGGSDRWCSNAMPANGKVERRAGGRGWSGSAGARDCPRLPTRSLAVYCNERVVAVLPIQSVMAAE